MRKPASGPQRPSNAYVCALRRLALRDHSERELLGVLCRNGFGEDEIATVIDRLRRERLVDDARFARRHAALRIGARGVGRNRVRSELRRRGVPPETVEAGLRDALHDVSEADALDVVARRYWKSHARIVADVRFRRLFAFLLRRGFAPALVSERLRSLWPEWRTALNDLDAASLIVADSSEESASGTTRED